MTLNDRSPEQVEEGLDDAEAYLSRAVDRAVRSWLSRLRSAFTRGIRAGYSSTALVAAARDPLAEVLPVTLGEATRWWAEEVEDEVALAVREVWVRSYLATRAGVVLESSLQGLDGYVASVSDRLVRGIEPPLPSAAMDRVRVALAQSVGEGWSNRALAQRIATDLGWETDADYWRARKATADDAIEAILDPLGAPGSAAREAARLNDPAVASWQAERSRAVLALDAEESYWQVRANRIARTESTGAYNAANLTALADEGVQFKEWVATLDARTRPDHVAAHGQQVLTTEPFIVGGASLMYPGAPGGPAGEVVNCRCTTIGRFADEVDPALAARAPQPDIAPAPE